MSDINYSFQHIDFSLFQAYYYTLVLQVSSKSFTYAVFYEDRLMALAPNCNLKELAEPKDMADELSASFKDIVVGIDADAFTLVPVELYQQERVTEYARFLDVKTDERVFAQQLDAENFIVYKTSDYVAAAIEKFDFNRSVYGGKGWINAIADKLASDKAIYVNIEDNEAEMMHFNDGKIRLYNKFNFNTADDLVYSVSLVFRETGLDQKDVQLSLSGTSAQMEEYRSRLTDFFSHTETNTLKIAELPTELNSDKILKLSALLLCVSSEAR
ncbi:DUF3822 family protein [Mucilaginibacter auburnensis]|uniref:Uncharacterized protein DUF3822 n=1 Tax=Mucilaginibacter auburnensis TaxID=1457233 RepID=A0A2H9VUT8_9SPHI|nr:DUF3822 family protein [Mucilaginibacter auburnensis]PJJ84552.1 uncharacterized protein DUF3822 [Mucilaginibacter auburnensis]